MRHKRKERFVGGYCRAFFPRLFFPHPLPSLPPGLREAGFGRLSHRRARGPELVEGRAMIVPTGVFDYTISLFFLYIHFHERNART